MTAPKVLPGTSDLGKILYDRTRELYMSTMENNPDFQGELDMAWFRRHFAKAAHEKEIVFHDHKLPIDLSTEEQEDRQRYNLYFGSVRMKLSAWLKERKRAAEKRAAAGTTLPAPLPKRLFPGASTSEQRATPQPSGQRTLEPPHARFTRQPEFPCMVPASFVAFKRQLHEKIEGKPRK